MHILIIGGTAFLGRALVTAAQARGHRLTLFHRGQTNPGLFPEVEEILGDRDGDLSPLDGRTWDAVIDTCGYFPRQVRASAGKLSTQTAHYTFISSLSVYADSSLPGLDEGGAVAELPAGVDADSLTEIGEAYGALKALCEAEAEAAMPGRTLILRPGLIVGPYDRSDRFTYWPWRIAQGGVVLAPGRPEHGVQFIDVRDLAEWTILMLEQQATGIYNVDSPPEAIPLGQLFDLCRQAGASDARLVWADDSFLLENGVGAWIELPLWLPESDPETAGFYAMSVRKALEAGLSLRPLADTVAATLAFARSRPADYVWRAGLAADKERALLAKLETPQA